MARSAHCYMCGELKGPGYEKYGYCKTCKHKKRSEERSKARAEEGLRPWGLGPNPICKDCGKTKEDIRQTRCNECRSVHDKAKRRERGLVVRVNTGRCPCGAERGAGQRQYCTECQRVYQQKWRDSKRLPPEQLAEVKAKRWEEAKFKRAARRFTETCIRIGVLVKQPCEVCGTEESVESHHDDYSKPMEIRWLCTKHHHEHHVNIGDLDRGYSL